MAKILIIDDSVVARLSLKACLPKDTHQLLEAADGLQGVALFTTERPDITFLDLTMPGMDGAEALRQIRTADAHARVIILTADIQRKTIERVMQLGAYAVIKKPPSQEAVLTELNRALAGA